MPTLVTSNSDDDSIKNELASMETPFSHYKSMGNILDAQKKFELVRDFMHVLITCKYKKDRMKSNRETVETSFSPLLSQRGLSVAMDTRVLIQSA